MDWFQKGSKSRDKNDTESLGITFEPIIFHPEINEYETCIKLPGCQKDQIKVTYEKATRKLKVQGKKQNTEFVKEFSAPADCLVTGIYGRFCGDVLRIIMPRMLSDRSPSNDASSKQEDDQKASSDREAAEHAGGHCDKLPARVPAPPPSDQRSTDEVKEIGGENQRRSMDKMLPAKRKWTASEDASSEKEDDQKASSDGKATAEAGDCREKSPVRAPADPESSEKSRQRDNELFPEISAPRPSAIEPRRSVRELRENYQKNISEIAAPPPPPPPPPSPPRSSSRAAATTPWNRKTTGIKARKEKEEDQKPPSTGDAESEKSILESQKNEKKTDQEVAKKAKIVTESKENKESEEKKPSAGGNVIFEMLAKVKETGKAAVAKVKETGEAVAKVAMKEENRPAVMIGAALLTIVVIGASLRSARKNKK
ncbi:hepatoma-derived growth factor-related protein 2-like [Cucurbita moschata]|uniref:Hepatoma-derived growth factor-related protein 2-like n=1 Tax=Cucurbita moschata TaxID=3662 RepID=A0A6J1GY55_CUCMO|nr:hepatoma-derived growth factor-related protein 2-like [Cucurbita moschata]